MYELNNKIRLICVPDFSITNVDEFIGFVCGIISQDHDLEQLYFDSFLDISCLKDQDITGALNKLAGISEQFSVDFIISISKDEAEIPEEFKSMIAAVG